MTHTTFSQSHLSVSSAVVNPLFSSMSTRVGESFATSASAKQNPAHCSAMIARIINNENAKVDYHAVLPPECQAGGDSQREELCQPDSERANEHDARRIKLRASGGSSSGLQVATEDPSREKKV